MGFRGVEYYRKKLRGGPAGVLFFDGWRWLPWSVYFEDVSALCDRVEELEGEVQRKKALAPRHEALEGLGPPWGRDE